MPTAAPEGRKMSDYESRDKHQFFLNIAAGGRNLTGSLRWFWLNEFLNLLQRFSKANGSKQLKEKEILQTEEQIYTTIKRKNFLL